MLRTHAMSILKMGIVVALAIALLGCAAATSGPNVRYTDPKQAEQLTTSFGRTDLQAMAEEMVQSMLQSPAIQYRPIVVVSDVKNNTTDQNIDTKAITDKIRVALTQSGKVRFLSAETRDKQMEEREYQEMSGNVDPQTAARRGRELGAQFQLSGEIISITKRTESAKDVYYKMTLNLVNLESGTIDWAGEKEISKLATRRAVGR